MAEFALVFVVMLWGSSFALQRLLFGGHEPIASTSLVSARLSAAALCVGLLLAIRWLLGRRQGKSSNWVRRPRFVADALVCGLCLGAGFLLQTEGLRLTSASRSAILTGLVVLFTPLFELLILRRRAGAASILGACLSFVGLGILANPWSTSANGSPFGDAMSTLCAVAFALHLTFLERASRRQPVWPLLGAQLLAASLLATTVSTATCNAAQAITASAWLVVAYLAVFCTVGAFAVQTWAQRKIDARKMALIIALEPVFGALAGWLFLGERMRPLEILGGTLVLGGVLAGATRASLDVSRVGDPDRAGARSESAT